MINSGIDNHELLNTQRYYRKQYNMGQGESVPAQSLYNAVEAYKKLQLEYDEVEDELSELYTEFDAVKASMMRKHGHITKLGNRFDRDDRVMADMTEEDLRAGLVLISLLYFICRLVNASMEEGLKKQVRIWRSTKRNLRKKRKRLMLNEKSWND